MPAMRLIGPLTIRLRNEDSGIYTKKEGVEDIVPGGDSRFERKTVLQMSDVYTGDVLYRKWIWPQGPLRADAS